MARCKNNTKSRSCAHTNVPGHPLWAKGSKNLFLEGFCDDFLTAHEQGFTAVGKFYDNITHC